MSKPVISAKDHVASHWGATAPDWVIQLADYCDDHSQSAAAKKVGRSASLINQVLKNRYEGNLNAVKGRVTAALKKDGVVCPILGRIDGSACLSHQKQKFNPNNHIAVSLFRACRTCPNRLENKEKHHE
jgi:hypothetical protein